VPLEDPFSFKAAQSQRAGELVMCDPVLAKEFDKERFSCLVAQFCSVERKLLLDLARDFKADNHGVSSLDFGFVGPEERGSGSPPHKGRY
jgi:hypothetical protein